MIDNRTYGGYAADDHVSRPAHGIGYRTAKRGFDILCALSLMPLLALFAAILTVANRFGNPGRLFFVQKRMGRDCRPIRVIKFRSMIAAPRIRRGADDPLETARITALGRILRKTRVDELPQIVNVLRGEMSMIGPRPDYFPHALHYVRTIPGYRARHAVTPGITGLAQVSLGYIEGTDATRAKVAADLRYARERGYRMDTAIVFRTIRVILMGGGS